MKIILYAASMACVLLAAGAAGAQSRYAERPPVLVSPDLSAPWVLQLRGLPAGVEPQARYPAQYRPHATPVRPAHQLRRPAERPVESREARQELRTMAAAPRIAPPAEYDIDPKFLPQIVPYEGKESPGTIVVDTRERFLYLVMAGGKARRYGVGVGKPGFAWAGTHKVTAKREWPDWRPPAEMIARERKKGRILPVHMKGGPNNPLGARALYLGSTLYRIHGTNAPWTIGQAVSSGCIRMRNEDVIDLYERVPVGTKVVVI
ncbi:L,D-transpeptidase [Chelativorans sp. SCAU2101]|jgi:Uncharacterized protein conserved in bacteria|uniref:L,D-transpeptidase n=1 Tax=Chelativorans petroleitrophicus TaxID=2975484 RepID=A0A9X2X8S4_9HYPH|nr:L,D-transpeptidase [Chelativorans petroleitrophicus]MCT8990241.1 L,D-transpeptidase [Chelativorans petroleitrophicus]